MSQTTGMEFPVNQFNSLTFSTAKQVVYNKSELIPFEPNILPKPPILIFKSEVSVMIANRDDKSRAEKISKKQEQCLYSSGLRTICPVFCLGASRIIPPAIGPSVNSEKSEGVLLLHMFRWPLCKFLLRSCCPLNMPYCQLTIPPMEVTSAACPPLT